MNFASEYVLTETKNRRRRTADPRPSHPSSATSAPSASAANLYEFTSEPDTNVVSMKFDQLVETCATHAGDPIKCGNCEAILSKISHINQEKETGSVNDGKKLWKCEFCNFENRIFLDENEIPNIEEVTYILEPAPSKNEDEANSEEELKEAKYLIYCIDISGSMSVTTPVKGNFELPTDKIRRENLQAATGETHMRFNFSGIRHISRLEAVQLAITSNFEKLVKENPEKRVGLVTFNNSVNVIGDGTFEQQRISGDYLNSKEEINKTVESTPSFKSINESKEVLNERLLNLEEGGATALGPALYYSIKMASRQQGSQVILCTDGLANKGIGSLESTNEEEKIAFYNEVAELASNNGVSVSILTIEGTNCKLGLIGDIADKTGGKINITDPLKLKEEFSNVLEEQIIATRVKATFILHKALYIRDHENINNRQSFTIKEIGNVTKETEITLEFGLRDDAEIDPNLIKELPFQLKIEYVALDGCKALKVLSNLKKITDNKQLAEEATDRKILATHVTQTKSKMVQRNAFTDVADKMSVYIKRIMPKKDDNFAEDTFNSINNDLDGMRAQTTTYMPSTARRNIGASSNAYENMTDIDSSRAYRYKNLKSNDLKKK